MKRFGKKALSIRPLHRCRDRRRSAPKKSQRPSTIDIKKQRLMVTSLLWLIDVTPVTAHQPRPDATGDDVFDGAVPSRPNLVDLRFKCRSTSSGPWSRPKGRRFWELRAYSGTLPPCSVPVGTPHVRAIREPVLAVSCFLWRRPIPIRWGQVRAQCRRPAPEPSNTFSADLSGP